MTVSMVSFAVPVGLPRETDILIGVRFLANPPYVGPLDELIGLDAAGAQVLGGGQGNRTLFGRLADLVCDLPPCLIEHGKEACHGCRWLHRWSARLGIYGASTGPQFAGEGMEGDGDAPRFGG